MPYVRPTGSRHSLTVVFTQSWPACASNMPFTGYCFSRTKPCKRAAHLARTRYHLCAQTMAVTTAHNTPGTRLRNGLRKALQLAIHSTQHTHTNIRRVDHTWVTCSCATAASVMNDPLRSWWRPHPVLEVRSAITAGVGGHRLAPTHQSRPTKKKRESLEPAR